MSQELIKMNEELEMALAKGVVKFTFRKQDGSLRDAIGTNKHSIVPNYYTFKGSTKAKSDEVVRYYDLEKAEYRSYRKENLVSFAA